MALGLQNYDFSQSRVFCLAKIPVSNNFGLPPTKDGGRSSMVEPQIVILVVAGSNPVDHPIFPVGFPHGIGRERRKLRKAWKALKSD